MKLDDKHYKLVDKMDALTEAVPSLIKATSLTVKGPVRFQAGTSFEGDVLINNGVLNVCIPCCRSLYCFLIMGVMSLSKSGCAEVLMSRCRPQL